MSDEVINDLFGYPGLKVIQRPDMLNFSIDSVLLAHFVTLTRNTKRILDIGTGNGAIALMLTKRTKSAITGIEIQEDVADMARRSVLLNQLEKQVEVIAGDVKTYCQTVGNEEKYDVIVTNPPFFKVDTESHLNVSEYKTIARHEVHLTLEELIASASQMLAVKGYFAIVHRADRASEICAFMEKYGIIPKRFQSVHPKVETRANGVLIEGIKGGNPGGLIIESPCVVHDIDGNYSERVKDMFLFGKDREDEISTYSKL